MASFRILVLDVDRAVDTYRKLGFEVATHFEGIFASVQRGDLTLWLSGPKASASRTLADGAQPAPGGWNRPVIEVEDLEAFRREIENTGLAFRNEPISGPGGTQALVEDGEGNVIEIFEAK